MNNNLVDTLKAVAGSTAVEVIHQTPSPDTTTEIIKIVTQLLIAAATIFSILRKRK